MKRLLTLHLLGVALAAFGTACVKGGGAGGTSPDPVPSGPPTRLSGTARYVRSVEADSGSISSSATWTVDVVGINWARDPNASPAPPAGGARFVVASGALHVSFREAVDFGRGKRCTSESRGEFPAPTATPSGSGEGSALELRPDGSYEGRLYGSVVLEYVQVCSDGLAFQNQTVVYLELDITGAQEGGRMRGEMPPRVLTTEVLTSTRAGSWDFGAN